MKNYFENKRVMLSTLLVSICLVSLTKADEDFDHLFEEYNSFREKQNKEHGIEDKSDGQGLTLNNQNHDSKTRQLSDQGNLVFFLICRP